MARRFPEAIAKARVQITPAAVNVTPEIVEFVRSRIAQGLLKTESLFCYLPREQIIRAWLWNLSSLLQVLNLSSAGYTFFPGWLCSADRGLLRDDGQGL